MNPLMEYLPPVSQPQGAPAHGADKYYGPIASGYDAKRDKDEKWIVEQKIITEMLSDLPAGSTVLDCPVGTGRFLEFYLSKGFKFIGVDLSGDMLIQSGLKCGASPEDLQAWIAASKQAGGIIPVTIDGDKGELAQGDVRNTGLPDKCVDVACNIRITRWLSPDDVVRMIREMQRVAKQRIILTARVANHPHARSIELIQSALDGWRIHRNEAGYITDYRVIELRPIA